MTPADTEPHPLLQKQRTSFATSNHTHATAQFHPLKPCAKESTNAAEGLQKASPKQHFGLNLIDKANLTAQLATQKFSLNDDHHQEKKTHLLNLHKQATSKLSLKKQTISEAMSYNFSLNRDAMQSQGLTPMSLIK